MLFMLLSLPAPPSLAATSAAARSRFITSGKSRRGLATVYLGLGSNVGDRHANILMAYKGLREVGARNRPC